jgi:hypothetical protein
MDAGRVRAFGPAAEIAERYMSEVNLRALANQQNALQSHRGGTGEIRLTQVDIVDGSGRPADRIVEGSALVVRAGYEAAERVHSPVFQIAIVDVDTGLVVASATSSAGDMPATVDGQGVVECVFQSIPLRRRQFVLRMTITDSHQLVSYDVVTAGPRFAVVAAPSSRAGDDDDDDGLVALPYRFEHRVTSGVR